jgi:hypothetical protein
MKQEVLKQKLLESELVVDNEQLDLYIELITKSLKAKAVKNLTQKHHFIPVSSYAGERAELKRLADADENNFTVNLTFFQHLSAHIFLLGCSKSFKMLSDNAGAVNLMYRMLQEAVEDGVVSKLETEEEINSAYRYLKEKKAQAKSKTIGEPSKKFDIAAFSAKTRTGNVVIHKDNEIIFVSPEEATRLVLSGEWEPGRTLKQYDIQRGYFIISKDGQSCVVRSKDTLLEYLKTGWLYCAKGFKSGIPYLNAKFERTLH